MSKLLIDESPLQVLPSLAKAIGLSQALFLQQLHYWITMNQRMGKHKTHYHNGRWWMYNTYQEWQDNNFPFWSISTLKRIVERLRTPYQAKKGDAKVSRPALIITTSKFNSNWRDQTLWYTIDYEALALVEERIKADSKLQNSTSLTKYQPDTVLTETNTENNSGPPLLAGTGGASERKKEKPDVEHSSNDDSTLSLNSNNDGGPTTTATRSSHYVEITQPAFLDMPSSTAPPPARSSPYVPETEQEKLILETTGKLPKNIRQRGVIDDLRACGRRDVDWVRHNCDIAQRLERQKGGRRVWSTQRLINRILDGVKEEAWRAWRCQELETEWEKEQQKQEQQRKIAAAYERWLLQQPSSGLRRCAAA